MRQHHNFIKILDGRDVVNSDGFLDEKEPDFVSEVRPAIDRELLNPDMSLNYMADNYAKYEFQDISANLPANPKYQNKGIKDYPFAQIEMRIKMK